MDDRTIAAIASAPGAAARGVIRLSGADVASIVGRCCCINGEPVSLGERSLFELSFHDGVGQQPALLLWMPGPASFTREDVAELHLCGNPHLLAVALEHLIMLGARAAEPGEFTRRAFHNGRLDLTRAEGVMELVAARTSSARRAASALLLGGLEQRITELRDELEAARTLCEASLDFDESDTGHVDVGDLQTVFERIGERMLAATRWEERRLPDAGMPRIVLSGPPNAGKSTLYNRLISSDTPAIVADVAGTTRDALRGVWIVAGVPCRLVDSAGICKVDGQSTVAEVERAAQQQAADARRGADILLWVSDRGAAASPAPTPDQLGTQAPLLMLSNKWDEPSAKAAAEGSQAGAPIRISAQNGHGLEQVEQAVASRLGLAPSLGRDDAGGGQMEGGQAGFARELSARHRSALRYASDAVRRAQEALGADVPLDLVAEDLRLATDELDQVSGRTTPEDLLDRIFSSFCLGK
ncbi:MAG: tRNA modification GTPase [Planctomycetota bacterium]